jgi:hypothetical protein
MNVVSVLLRFWAGAGVAAPNCAPTAAGAFAGEAIGTAIGGTAATVGGTVGVGAAAAALPIFATLAGLYGIAAAHERGAALGRYNAFLVAFAQSVSDFSRGCDRRRRDFRYQDSSIRGRNAAIAVLNAVGPEERRKVFRAYGSVQDDETVRRIIAALGGLRTR